MTDKCPNIEEAIDYWYSLSNVPITANMSNIEQLKQQVSNLVPQKFSLVWLINLFYKIIKIKSGVGKNGAIELSELGPDSKHVNMTQKYVTPNDKTNIYNMFNALKYYNPVIFIIFTILVITDCEPIWKIGDSVVVKNIPTSYNFLYMILFAVVMGIIVYKFFKQFSCFSGLMNSIKSNGIKSHYVMSFIIVICFVVLFIFVIPSIIDPIVDVIGGDDDSSSTTGLSKSWIKKLIVYGLFFIGSIILVLVTAGAYKKRIFGSSGSIMNLDSQFYSITTSIGTLFYVIFSLLLITGIVTYVFNGLGSFIVACMLAGVYFCYIVVIYVMVYSVIEGPQYNKILAFSLILLIVMTIAGLYVMYEVVNTMENSCKDSDTTNITMFSLFANLVLPMVLFALFLYLYGMIYTDQNWLTNKGKFYTFYSIYTIIIVISWFSSNISVGTIYTILWIVLTIIQWKWVKKWGSAIKYELASAGKDVKRMVKNVEKNVNKI